MTRATPTEHDTAYPDGLEGTGKPFVGTGDGTAPSLEAFRRSMGRFRHLYAALPVRMPVTCGICRQLAEGVFDRVGEQLVLTSRCSRCGTNRQVHYDTVFSVGVSDRPGSPGCTLAGVPIQPVARRLPRTVESLCPECRALILGRVFVEDAAVYMEKSCPEHGYFRDCVSRDALLYSKASWWTFGEAEGQRRPARPAGACPAECGLCGQHQSASCLAQIDLTNRCDMRCPICFANAGAAGYTCEPTRQQIRQLLQQLRDMDPYPATAVQFTGGEPTVHPQFLGIVADARAMGFSHIQIATNGLRLADADFASAAAEAGLHTLYLQFDGVGEEPHRQTRNYPGIWAKKLAVIENCRSLGIKICLVPTIIKGVNDDQVGEVFRFAIENIDVISGVSYQPVSFSGRIDPSRLAAQRYTLGDLAHDIAAASGAVPLRDMYPLSIVVPLSEFLQAVTGEPKIRPSCHPDCAFGTYFLISPDGQAVPFPQVIDVEGMFTDMNRMARRLGNRRPNWLDWLAIKRMFKRHFRPDAAPPGLDVKRFMHTLKGLVDKGVGRGRGEESTYKTLLCAGMHFQDCYNFDVQRVKRCIILYSTPEGVFPFCTYNCGPEYRRFVEFIHKTSPAGGDDDYPVQAGPAAEKIE